MSETYIEPPKEALPEMQVWWSEWDNRSFYYKTYPDPDKHGPVHDIVMMEWLFAGSVVMSHAQRVHADAVSAKAIIFRPPRPPVKVEIQLAPVPAVTFTDHEGGHTHPLRLLSLEGHGVFLGDWIRRHVHEGLEEEFENFLRSNVPDYEGRPDRGSMEDEVKAYNDELNKLKAAAEDGGESDV